MRLMVSQLPHSEERICDSSQRIPIRFPVVAAFLCSSLISLQETLENAHEGNTGLIVRLVHFSVKEYLVLPSIRNERVKDASI